MRKGPKMNFYRDPSQAKGKITVWLSLLAILILTILVYFIIKFVPPVPSIL